MARVKLDNLRKVYENGDVAVHSVSVEVADGEFVVLVGPSGCGKSTTLRMVAGLEAISGGTLMIGDRVVNDLPPKDRDIAMVFQNYALYPHMTVYENMAFALKLRKRPRAEIDERVRKAAETLGLTPVLDRSPKQLSGGQRQRVAIGRAIVREPQVFLFDEPLSNLDAKLRVQMRREIAKLQRALGVTAIYVTHDQVEAMTMGDRIVVLERGRVQQIDTPLGLYNRPANAFVATFIGSPAMNMVPGTIERGDLSGGLRFRGTGDGDGGAQAFVVPLRDAIARRLAAYEGKHVTLGVRPEDIAVAGAAGPVATVRARLELIEPLGNEVLVYARAGAHDLTARVAPRALPEPPAEIELALNLAHLHFFETEGGAVIDWRNVATD
jgi:multiple sugar transport system ATP-binding protein